MAQCKSCDAEIEWCRSQYGSPMPLDVTRDGRGNIIETPGGNLALVNGQAHAYTEADRKLARDRRRSHFATCPQGDKWRGGAR